MPRTDARVSPFVATAVAVVAFGVAMGWLEAVVVVYLRSAIGLAPGHVVPAHDPATVGTFEAVEIAREFATLVMIGAVGWLAGRSALERLAWAAVVFGTWDVVYYAGLWVVLSWPPALDTWDVLFLIPSPWVGPVWAPLVVSAALIGYGLVAARRLRGGRFVRVTASSVGGAVGGGVLVIASFLVDATAVLRGGEGADWTGWPLFAAGMALALISASLALLGGGQDATARVMWWRPRRSREGSSRPVGASPPNGGQQPVPGPDRSGYYSRRPEADE